MWQPKNRNNDIYVGKLARIYCTNGGYVEGKLIYIKECKAKPGAYTVCVESVTGYPTRHSVSDGIIDHLDVQIFEILDETKKICNKHLNHDMNNSINQYVNPFVTI